MPGSVSDSYDPEFGTGANADEVAEACRAVKQLLTDGIGSDSKDILSIVRGEPGRTFKLALSEREWRIVRFAVNRGLESL